MLFLIIQIRFLVLAFELHSIVILLHYISTLYTMDLRTTATSVPLAFVCLDRYTTHDMSKVHVVSCKVI